jgi:serine/threonine protein kinase
LKEITYFSPNVKVGNGKYGPVELIIYKDDLYALKKIPKSTIDKPKRIEHLKNEKNALLLLRKEGKKEPLNFIAHLEATFTTPENANFVLEYLPGQDLFWVI